jgi:hypothetical protein
MFPTTRTVLALLLGFGALAPALGADDPPAANSKIANARARAEAAAKVYKGILERRQVDASAVTDPDRLYQWSQRWMEAEQELSDKKDDRIRAAEAHLDRMKKVETTLTGLLKKAHTVTPGDAAAATFFRLEAERTLANLKEK